MRVAEAHSSTAPILHVVVSCKSRKTVEIPADARMSALSEPELKPRVDAWIDGLLSSTWPAVRAGDLYAGDHWKVVLGIPRAAPADLRVKLWVASAGYGLVDIDTPLKPYSATFVRGHVDSVVPSGARFNAEDWWREVNAQSPAKGPSNVGEVLEVADPSSSFLLLALSEPYACAMATDIHLAAKQQSGRVGLISVGLGEQAEHVGLASAALPVVAKLKQVVGGAMQGVNARIARRVVEHAQEWFPDFRRLEDLIRSWSAELEPLPQFSRTPISDAEVIQFIEQNASGARIPSKSALLRRLRDAGFACEQSRFGRLYSALVAPAEVSHGAQHGASR